MSCEPSSALGQDEPVIDADKSSTSLTALISQMQQNWDAGNDAANDDLVAQICDHIRRQQAVAAACGHLAYRYDPKQ